MKNSIWLLASSVMLLFFSGCADQTDPDGLGTGPYDAAGNYHEEWADDPSKWRKPQKNSLAATDDLPLFASNDEPPPNSNPLASSSHKSSPIQVDSVVQSTKHQTSEPVEIASRTRTSSSSSKPKSKASASSSKGKSKHTVAKAKPKTKPKAKSSRYIVKKGDSLSRIASRNGSSVSAIQRANGISGTLIKPGQSLIVPKR